MLILRLCFTCFTSSFRRLFLPYTLCAGDEQKLTGQDNSFLGWAKRALRTL